MVPVSGCLSECIFVIFCNHLCRVSVFKTHSSVNIITLIDIFCNWLSHSFVIFIPAFTVLQQKCQLFSLRRYISPWLHTNLWCFVPFSVSINHHRVEPKRGELILYELKCTFVVAWWRTALHLNALWDWQQVDDFGRRHETSYYKDLFKVYFYAKKAAHNQIVL